MPDPLANVFVRYGKLNPAKLEEVVVGIKKLQEHQADTKSQGYYDRLQRACSWLAKAKRTSNDWEGKFIFLWIVLNALCGIRQEVLDTEWWKREERTRPALRKRQRSDNTPRELEWFLWRVCGLDVGERILKKVLEEHRRDVERVLGTPYLMANYWNWECGTEEEINERKESGQRTVEDAINSGKDREKMYRGLCEIIIWRLRTLRNQLFHGCATDTHSKRREAGESELEAGSRLLEELIWAFLFLMAGESGRARYWPPCSYPRAGSAQHQPFDASWLPK